MKILLLLLAALPAFADDDNPPPPNATTRATWLFSWTNNPAALADPSAHVTSQLAYAGDCVNKIHASVQAGQETPVAGCEGNRMAAGPGLYTCDNPFTSHDYGGTLLVMKTKPNDRNVANESGLVAPADQMDRGVIANTNYEAIYYDFRPTDTSTAAVVVRSPSVLDASQTYAIKAPPGDRKEWHFHEAFPCTPQTPIKDVLTHWGDQLDFLSLTYDKFRDPADKGFEKNGQVSDAGLIAALASNVVAISDDELKAKLAKLSATSAELKGDLGSEGCSEAEHSSPRMCLAYELFDSVTENDGTPNHPTHAWSLAALKKALLTLGIADSATLSHLADKKAILGFLAGRFTHDAHQAQRVHEAFGCMKAVRAQLQASDFATWTTPGGAAPVTGQVPAAAPAGQDTSAQ